MNLPSQILIIVNKQLYWKKIICGCFRSYVNFYIQSSVFSEMNPQPSFFFHLKSFPWKFPLTVKAREKNMDQILSYISFCFEIRTHLGHLFVYPPKIIQFNSWSSLKNEPSTKLNHIFIVQISFWVRNAIKHEAKNVKKKQWLLFNFCNIFDLLICRTAKNMIFTCFPILNNSRIFKEI